MGIRQKIWKVLFTRKLPYIKPTPIENILCVKLCYPSDGGEGSLKLSEVKQSHFQFSLPQKFKERLK